MPGRSAHSFRSASRAARNPSIYRQSNADRPAGFGGRLLPATAILVDPPAAVASRPCQPLAGDLLPPSVGDRSRAAATTLGALAVQIPSLPQSRPDRTTTAAPAANLRLDAHGPALLGG